MIQTILSFFALGAIGFWLLLSVASIILIATIENEHYKFPSWMMIILGLFYWKPISDINWRFLLLGICSYIAIGTLWSIFRWFRFVKTKVNQYQSKCGNILTKTEMCNLKSELLVNNNKERITAWIAFWMWSLFWNITGDLFTTIFETLHGIYQKISNKATGGFTVE